ncbi:MAG: lipid-A-disaccharide synthase [Blastocatellia bacterium]|nr:lipid-A-disaccharide synthase [Blastocatellia bacterium]MCS7156549.1 lipid-A-disaccharide synthase [Blastocatellia bacterium]MDW8168811.1 lipid-A-disaccharide synthase [Acidobacteriota bacterium]MDW8257475.1 lipid-A-disaccharide synthase [Acidobacteriota bacterium]
MNSTRSLMVLAGEASGDERAAEVLRALKTLAPEGALPVFGCGGPALRAEGAETLADIAETAIIGPVEIARALARFYALYRRLLRIARERRPTAALLVDWPEFNMKLLRPLKRMGVRTIYYIGPQVWAWRTYRVRALRRYVDRLIVILPFEVEFYRRHGIVAEYVGHPLVDVVRPTLSRAAFYAKHGLSSDRPVISLLPGSRRTEVERILPFLARAARALHAQWPAQFLIPLAATISPEMAWSLLRHTLQPMDLPVRVLERETYDALAYSDLAVITSGTATLEAALLGTPMIVVYRARAINYLLVRPLLHLDTFGMVNLLAGERIVPELIQWDLTPERLAGTMMELLADPKRREIMQAHLAEVRKRLGEAGAARRAAEIIWRVLTAEAPGIVGRD